MARITNWLAGLSLVAGVFTLALATGWGRALVAGEDEVVLADFETDADKVFEAPGVKDIVKEHAKSGEHSLRITHDGKGYPGIAIDKPAELKRFSEFPIFAVDVFNPSSEVVHLSARCDDAKSTSYGTRYNDDGLVVPPGWSTLRINLTGMTTSNSNNFLERRPIDLSTVKLFNLFLNGGKPVVLYFDKVRLEGTGLPKVEGLAAYDFGPSSSAVFPGFVGVNEKSGYSEKTGFGWGTPLRARRPGNPDDLGGDYGSGDVFTAQMQGGLGEYVVQLCVDSLGEWGGIQHFNSRTITINGKEVLNETIDGAKFMQEHYFKFIDGDDLPGIDLWNDRIKPLTPVRTFTTTVGADGKLSVKVDTQGGWPGLICFMVAYPKAKQAEGDKFMLALDARRKLLFTNSVIVQTPAADHPAVKATAEESARGFVWFSRSATVDTATSSQPTDAERGVAVVLNGCRDERLSMQVGVLPLKDAKALKVSVGDLSGPGGAKIAGSAVQVRKVRIFAKRQGGSNSVVLEPFMLQEFAAMPLTKDVTRSVWLTLVVPADAAPGAYTGSVALDVDGKITSVPMSVTVYPFVLAPVDDISISGLGTTAGSWRGMFAGLEERWWAMADKVMADQAAHGCNAVTGGPGMQVTSVKDGKAEIDFTDADRWMELAKKHGLTMPGDSYQGFDVNMGFGVSQKGDCMETNEKNAQQKWGISFEALVRTVYGTVAAHAKEKAWPVRSYYLLDEPRAEFGNIESALHLLELYAKATPETRISGYTTVSSEGREKYVAVLPVVISHPNEAELKRVIAAGKECWDYGAGVINNGFGRWLYSARMKGLKGFTTGFMYVNSNPYYDFSDVEGGWGIVQPGPDGDIATVNWERLSGEVNSYRYLKTLQEAVTAAKKAGRNAAAADAAQAFLDGVVKGVDIGKRGTASLDDAKYAAYKAELLGHLKAVQ